MIYGIGADIVEFTRFARIRDKHDKLVHRILSMPERAIYHQHARKVPYLAKRFAAKEAFAKALGTGIGKIVSFQDLTIINDTHGKPQFIVSKSLQHYLTQHQIRTIHLSLADEQDYALAFVVLEIE